MKRRAGLCQHYRPRHEKRQLSASQTPANRICDFQKPPPAGAVTASYTIPSEPLSLRRCPTTPPANDALPCPEALSAGPTPLGSALSPLRMACQTKGHGRNSHAYPGGRGVQTLEHTDTAETRVQVGLRAIGRLIGRSASRSGLNTASVRVNTRGGSTASGRFRDLRVCLLRVGQGVYCLCVFSQRSRRYGALFGHSASQAGLASTHGSPNTAVPALRCPSWAFGEPSWTCYTPLTTHHSSPGVTVSILGIRRAKLDVLHATDHPSQQSRRYGVHLGHSASQAGRATRH